MKNTFLKTVGNTTLGILILLTLAQTSVTAQERSSDAKLDEPTQEDSSARLANTRRLEGSWDHQGMRLNCETGATIGTFSALFTFNREGTFWESGSQVSPALRSPSHGLWSYESMGQYSTAFRFFRFNADGTLAGRQVVRQQINLGPDGNSYTATATAQVFDVNGNVIANNCAAGSGTRFE